jgi:hypothetical protein
VTSASKRRPQWNDLPAAARADIERLVGAAVVRAQNCPGGFSPGFASRLVLADGRRAFVKAMDSGAWPGEVALYRAEARIAAALPPGVPAPRLLGAYDGSWTILAFEDVDGAEPRAPWRPADLERVVATVLAMERATDPGLVPRDHPRLGGWAALAENPSGRARLPAWAAEHLPRLVRLESESLAAARGDALVHSDLYPHNILLTPERVVFVDWPHARLGNPTIDLVTLLSSAAADGIDPEPFLRGRVPSGLDAILAAHAGFLLHGGLQKMPAGLAAIAEAKLRLGLGAVTWLRRRLGD